MICQPFIHVYQRAKHASRSDITNSNTLIISFHFLKQENWAVTHPQRCLYVCKPKQQLVLNLPFLQRNTPSSNHLFMCSVNIMITYHVPSISETCSLYSELKLIMHLPIEILSVTWLLLDTGKQGALPRTQGFLCFSPFGCPGQVKLSVPTGQEPWARTRTISHLLGAPNIYCFPHCSVDQMPPWPPELTTAGSSQKCQC